MDELIVELLEWGGPAPTSEVWSDQAGHYATLLHYGEPSGRRLTIVTLRRRQTTSLSLDRGIVGTSIADAKRAAVVAAADLIQYQSHQPERRAAVKAALGAWDADWHPTALRFDDATIPGETRAVMNVAWAAAVELPTALVAIAGPAATALNDLVFTEVAPPSLGG